MGAVIIEGIAEGLALRRPGGGRRPRAADAIAGGSGSSWILREWLPDTLFRGDFAKRFSLDLMCKDMRIVEAMADELGVACPRARGRTRGVRRGAVAEPGHGDEDFSRGDRS